MLWLYTAPAYILYTLHRVCNYNYKKTPNPLSHFLTAEVFYEHPTSRIINFIINEVLLERDRSSQLRGAIPNHSRRGASRDFSFRSDGAAALGDRMPGETVYILTCP